MAENPKYNKLKSITVATPLLDIKGNSVKTIQVVTNTVDDPFIDSDESTSSGNGDGRPGSTGPQGATGAQGPTGATSGIVGPTGPRGINTTGFRIQYNRDITSSNPGSGKFKFNNANPFSATQVYISDTDLDGFDVDSLSDALTQSTNPNKSVITFRLESDQSIYDTAYVNSQTDNGSWRTLNITHIDQNGNWGAVSAGSNFFMSIDIIGDKGDTGPAGNPNMTLTAPNGNVYQLGVDNSGNLTTTLIP